MADKSIQLELTKLLPTLSTFPPQLTTLASSLLAQSRNKASNLKPQEEVARPYACAHIACERYRSIPYHFSLQSQRRPWKLTALAFIGSRALSHSHQQQRVGSLVHHESIPNFTNTSMRCSNLFSLDGRVLPLCLRPLRRELGRSP